MLPKVLETAAGEWLGIVPAVRAYLDAAPGVAPATDGTGTSTSKVGILCVLSAGLRVASGFCGLIDWRLDGQITAAVRSGVFVPTRDAWLDLGACDTLGSAHLVLLGVGHLPANADLVHWQAMGRTCAGAGERHPEIDTWMLALPEVGGGPDELAAFARGLVAGRRDGKIAVWDQRGPTESVVSADAGVTWIGPEDVELVEAKTSSDANALDCLRRGLELTLVDVQPADYLDVSEVESGAGEQASTSINTDETLEHEMDPADLEPTSERMRPPPLPAGVAHHGAGQAGFDSDALVLTDPRVSQEQTNAAASSAGRAGDGQPAESSTMAPDRGAMRTLTWWIVTPHRDIPTIQARIGAVVGQLPLS